MEICFKSLTFTQEGEKLYLSHVGDIAADPRRGFCEVQVAGENKVTHMGIKMACSSEGQRLTYVSHTQTDNTLEIVQKTDLIETTTTFTAHDDCDAVQVKTTVQNMADRPIVLEEVSAMTFSGIGTIDTTDRLFFTRFFQCNFGECQPETYSFRDLGLYRADRESPKRIAFCNVGSWSTKEELPQGIIEDRATGEYVMFQIESNNSWYYEIGDVNQKYYLYLGGANASHGGWSKKLAPGESYTAPTASLAFGKSLCGVLGEMTKHRRHMAGRCAPDDHLPTIFNEYMHLSWNTPTEEATARYAPVVASTGVEYYVIDCGWHDADIAGGVIFQYVGSWQESTVRFPAGVRKTMDRIRANGMKPGLWIEPEVIGWKCTERLSDYDKDCFFCRHDEPVCIFNRLFLDYRNPKVVAYMNETIRYMVEDLGAEYIKMDYNQDCGIGTDLDALTPGEGLESASRAYLDWIDGLRARFPQVLFETCSSGGMRMDYATMSHFSIVSTSDQTDYKKYPYIAGNILAAVNPEQAAVWSYPVDNSGVNNTKEAVEANISDEQVIMNMINSFLGRLHLASHLDLLGDKKLALVQEGVAYHKTLATVKRNATPYMPLGFTGYGKTLVASGLLTAEKLYLAVWNLNGEKNVRIPLGELSPKAATVAYPKSNTLSHSLEGNVLSVSFTENYQARFFEIDL